MPKRRIRGLSWQRKRPLHSAAPNPTNDFDGATASNHTLRRPSPQPSKSLYVASQPAHLSAVVLRPRSLAIMFPRSGSRILASTGGAGERSAQTDRRLWCVYDGEMYLRLRGVLMLRPAACNSYDRVPAVAVPSVLIIAPLSNAILSLFGRVLADITFKDANVWFSVLYTKVQIYTSAPVSGDISGTSMPSGVQGCRCRLISPVARHPRE